MRTRVGKIKTVLACAILGVVASPEGVAQNPAEPPANAPAEGAAPPSVPSAPMKASVPPDATKKAPAAERDPSSSAAALDYLYNRKPQDGSLAKQANDANRRMEDKAKAAEALGLGKAEDAGDLERFEKYLGISEVSSSDLKGYGAVMGQVVGRLREGNTFEAWKLLHQAAVFEVIDAGVSRELANRIESLWNTNRANQKADAANQRLQQQIKESNRNADLLSKSVKEDEARFRRTEGSSRPQGGGKANNGGVPMAGGEGGPSTSNMAGLEGKLQLTEQYLQSLEAKAKIKLNDLKLEKLFDTSKKDFSAYIGTLYGSRRYVHVIVAADFYRKIFNEDVYPVGMANQVNAALEIQRSVASAVDVFRYKSQRNEIAAATDRLREAYKTCEFHPSLLGLERSYKEKIAQFTANLRKMQNLIEARDFTSLETLLNETKALAVDFDTAKPLALVNAVKLESKLRLGKAKLAAQQGDQKTAMDEFQAAAETWPGNPDLQDKALTFFESQDVKNQSLVEFDRLFAEENYRAIFDKQLAFAPAMKDDLKRQDQLKAALTKIKDAEMASEKANAMMIAGDPFGAWEAVELATKDLPDDKKLNKLRADLSVRSAEFVSAINKARDAETRNDFGFSLTWYVNAQRQYPASRIANDAIDRISKQILGGGKPATL